ncbi:MAG: aminoacyl-histidine dipeptidase [Crocinitomicaceae bacterium]|nr:aminoacyl-histidine dipeptidase [Crocinitomicaceae bacterium]
MPMSVRNLEPKAVWNHFEDLNAVPRASKKEEKVRQFMKDFGSRLGLETLEDEIGNVIIKKPATAGMENRETVIMQSHLDMVHQKNSTTKFDFDTEGIRSFIDGDWVKAEGTTLGADNGMGVASIMAILESTDIPHPAIEALFTIDEETGMTGALNLDGSLLEGKILLNLDTEDDDELCIGCAGGIDTNSEMEVRMEPTPEGYTGIKLSLTGLTGGHSGMDIILGRANANKIMNRFVLDLYDNHGARIVEIDGGSLRNAIPRESFVTLAIPISEAEKIHDSVADYFEEIYAEYETTDPEMSIEIEDCLCPEQIVSLDDQNKIINAIYSIYNGVYKMSAQIEGLVETSSSLARVIVKEGWFKTQSLQRSSVESSKMDIANTIRAALEAVGSNVQQGGDYPGWAPNASSPILKETEEIYKKLFNEEPKVQACHAGLECGILGDRVPGLDMISFGPTIKAPHSPDERVNIKSVQKFWTYLLEVLKNIPSKN